MNQSFPRYGATEGDRLVTSFISRLFPAKSNGKISCKLHFGPNVNFSGKPTKATSGTFFLDFDRCVKFQKKLIYRFWEKLVADVGTDGWAEDARKDEHKFVESLLKESKYFFMVYLDSSSLMKVKHYLHP